MRNYAVAFAILATLTSQPAKAAPHVLVIAVDGLRADAMEVASTPTIDALIANGTYSRNATVSDLTFSGPGHSDILLGVHRDLHGVATNSTSDNPAEADPQFQIFSNSNQHLFPDFLAIANNANPNLQTARFTGEWNPIHTTRSPDGSEYTFLGNDAAATADAVSYYGNAANDAEVGYIYYANPDFAGHGNGFNPTVAAYTNQISATDAQIGSVIAAIQSRPNYATEDWAFILASDHGGNLGGGHSGNQVWQREAPFIVSGDSIMNQSLPFGAKNVDVVPTALTHLGIALPSHLVGHAIGFSPPVLPTIALDSNLVFNGDAEYDHGFPSDGFDQAVTGWNEFADANFISETSSYGGNDSITTIAYGSNGFPAAGAGDNFFSSGGDVNATMSQEIDLSSLATDIDAGINFQLDARLGGNSGSDRADLTVEWLGTRDVSLGTAIMNGPVAANGLFFNRRGAVVPVGARKAVVSLTTLGSGVYADEISLLITADDVVNTSTLIGDFDDDGDLDGDDWLIFVAQLGSDTPGNTDLTGDGVNNHADFLSFKKIFEDHNGLGSFEALHANVPEPTCCCLAGLGLMGLLLAGHRNR